MVLPDIKVRTVKPANKPFKLTDSEGMHLLVNPNSSKNWRLQYRFNGKQKMLALEVYPIVSLAKAGKRCDVAKKLVSDGIDPSQKKEEKRFLLPLRELSITKIFNIITLPQAKSKVNVNISVFLRKTQLNLVIFKDLHFELIFKFIIVRHRKASMPGLMN